MDRIKLKVLIKRAVLDGIKYHYDLAEVGRGCNFDQFAEDRVKDFERACDYDRLVCQVSPLLPVEETVAACNIKTKREIRIATGNKINCVKFENKLLMTQELFDTIQNFIHS
jgi:hypothetical protein